jgi:hypothetical protein
MLKTPAGDVPEFSSVPFTDMLQPNPTTSKVPLPDV